MSRLRANRAAKKLTAPTAAAENLREAGLPEARAMRWAGRRVSQRTASRCGSVAPGVKTPICDGTLGRVPSLGTLQPSQPHPVRSYTNAGSHAPVHTVSRQTWPERTARERSSSHRCGSQAKGRSGCWGPVPSK